MFKKITIKKIARNQKISKSNKEYIDVGLLTEEFGQTWINGFGNKSNQYWKEGDSVVVKITEQEWQGNKQLRFEPVRIDDVLELALRLQAEVANIKTQLGGAKVENKPMQTNTEKTENIPF